MEYLDYLIEQYKQATGIKNVDANSATFIDDFTSWVRERQMLGRNYVGFLDYMDFYGFTGMDCAEVNKGEYDTIVQELDATIITPFSKGMEKVVDTSRIITGNMKVYNGVPILVKPDNGLIEIPSDYIRTYMTQNPYSPLFIANWEQLHNSGNNNIVMGVFGTLSDKDRLQKIKQMRDFKEKFSSDDIKEDYTEDSGNYYYALGSDRLVKRLVRTRTR